MSGVGVVLLIGLIPTTSLLGEITRLDNEIGAATASLRQHQREAFGLAEASASVTTNLAVTRLAHERASSDLQRRVRALARLPAAARLKIMGGAASLADLLTTRRMLRLLSTRDQRLRLELEVRARTLEGLEVEILAKRRAAELALAKVRDSQAALAQLRGAKLLALAEARRDPERRRQLARERTASTASLLSLVGRLAPMSRGKTMARARGDLPWPTTGTLRRRFGPYRDEATAAELDFEGLEFAAPAGSPVQAVAPGTVAWVGTVDGYGLVVVIDHGAGVHTVSGHLGQALVRVGDEVVSGTALGEVGDSGLLEEAALHFEVRVAGKATDPLPWLRR